MSRSKTTEFRGWLLNGWWPAKSLLLLSLAIVALLIYLDSRQANPPWKTVTLLGDTPDDVADAQRFPVYRAVSHYVVVWLLLAIPAFLLGTFRRGGRLPLAGVTLFFLALIALIVPSDLIKNWDAVNDLTSGEMPSRTAYFWKIGLITGALLMPPFLLWWYQRQTILVRYVTRSFVLPLLFCLLAFIAIWLLMDLGDNLGDYRSKNATLLQVARIYGVQMPMLIVEIFPVALLLSTLYSLGRLSRSNEMTAMMSAGQSILKIIMPYILAGVAGTVLCLILNYHWAPRALGLSKSLIDSLGEEHDDQARFKDHLYRNSTDGRMWYVGRVPFDLNLPFRDVMLFEEDQDGRLANVMEAGQARWVPKRRQWVFASGRHVHFPPIEAPNKVERARLFGAGLPGQPNSYIVRVDLAETPWLILSSTLKPEQLSVPELVSYQRANELKSTEAQLAPYQTHFWLRFSQPFKNLVLVLIAAPLGIVLSRRGFLGGIAVCIVVFFVLLFLENLFMKLGTSGHLNPVLAAWTPYAVTGFVGVIMLYYRVRQKDLPSLNPRKWLPPAKT